ncbi:hypothetical protein [Methylocella sp.]|uniref:hypothetical protein n=1 Tax=Methylocella sp. TaxID=1978226 RepID=UPI003782E315
MQLPTSPDADKFLTISNAIQKERLFRYMPAAENILESALRYYIWNCRLCEGFHPVLHYSEILCRNSFNRALIKRAGEQWYLNNTFRGILDDRNRDQLSSAISEEAKQHRDKMTAHHVVSALTFGFWDHLATKRFERFIWAKGIQAIFPNAPKTKTREDAHLLIESVRRWRNRIAHHRAIFDRGPTKKHGEALQLIEWVCPDTKAWVASISDIPAILQCRPTTKV